MGKGKSNSKVPTMMYPEPSQHWSVVPQDSGGMLITVEPFARYESGPAHVK